MVDFTRQARKDEVIKKLVEDRKKAAAELEALAEKKKAELEKTEEDLKTLLDEEEEIPPEEETQDEGEEQASLEETLAEVTLTRNIQEQQYESPSAQQADLYAQLTELYREAKRWDQHAQDPTAVMYHELKDILHPGQAVRDNYNAEASGEGQTESKAVSEVLDSLVTMSAQFKDHHDYVERTKTLINEFFEETNDYRS